MMVRRGLHSSHFILYCFLIVLTVSALFNHAGMYICSQSGELVHPIHLQHLVEEEQEAMEDDAEEQTLGTSPPLERGAPVHSVTS